MVSLFYRENHNDIQPFIVYYPTLTVGDSLTKCFGNNAAKHRYGRQYGHQSFADVHMGGKLSMRMNVFLFTGIPSIIYRHRIQFQ